MRRRTAGIVAAAAGIAVLAVALAGIHRGLHHRLYAPIAYATVADRVTRGAATPEEAARRLEEFVYLNLRTPAGAPVLNDAPLPMLTRGFGYCDQAVMVFVHLVGQTGSSARSIFLRRVNGESPHTVAEVWLDGGWRVFDVLYGFVPRGSDGRIAISADLVRQPALLGPSRARPEWYQHATVFFTLDEAASPPGFMGRTRQWIQRLARHAPDRALDVVQDLYLRLPPPSWPLIPEGDGETTGTEARSLYFRGRNYQLFLRAREAERAYRTLVDRYPSSRYADDALYQLGLVELTLRGDPAAALATLDTLRERHADSPWVRDARYLQARAHEAAGRCSTAARLYREIGEGDGNGREDARMRLGQLPCS
jgi:Transglutaminase-like superfamily/Tetratricopeptide repeat